MKWDVRGAWKADGRPGQLVVEADNQRAGELIANDRGLLVESCWPVRDGEAAPVRRRGGLARKLGLFLAIVGATLAVVGFAIQTEIGDWILRGGVATFALGVVSLILGVLLLAFRRGT